MSKGDGMDLLARWTIKGLSTGDMLRPGYPAVIDGPDLEPGEQVEVVRADAYQGAVKALQRIADMSDDDVRRWNGSPLDSAFKMRRIAQNALSRYGGQ